MLIKLNNKPIKIEEETQETKEKSLFYYAVSYTGYLMILYLLDYMCLIFFHYHPLPWITFVGKIISFLGRLF